MTTSTLPVHVAADEAALDRTGAIAAALRERFMRQSHVRMVFAAAPGRRTTPEALIGHSGLDRTGVIAFHLDEYLDLPPEAPVLTRGEGEDR